MSLEPSNQLVSIIIPFYNEEDYLDRAISSVIEQAYSNIEIILVNDGSTDNSKTIAQTYKKNHKNIKLITTSNIGLGNARNTGIKNSSGNYILFLDADDAITKNAVNLLVKNIVEYNSDISICKFNLYDCNKDLISVSGFKSSSKTTDNLSACKAMYTHNISSTVWAKLYKRTVISQIQFLPSVWFEDRPYLLEYFLKTQKVSFVNDALANIYARENSISRRYISKRRIIDHHTIFLKELKLVKKYQKENELSYTILEHHLYVMLDNYLIISIDKNSISPSDFKKCKKTFIKHVNLYYDVLKKDKYKLKLKKQVLLFLLKSSQFIHWNLLEILISKILYRTRYRMIQHLKN
ncbi:Glyco_trans_2-like domain-containing protein [Tenacibaculum sp. 190524A02b]|uniref:Glyco_trans_2-like domain-containing protein n=1 Tax=Tenacibaculum vairaonense TaxID=3137860 RepID=A0ABP1FIT3_9FLAO